MRTRRLLGFVVCALLVSGCGAAKGPYVKANQQLLALAKPYPGAKVVRVDSDPYNAPESEIGPPVGYTTVAYYVLESNASPLEVAAFYRDELAGWHERIRRFPCRVVVPPPGRVASRRAECPPGIVVAFSKGNAEISLQLDGLTRAGGRGVRRMYDVSVDHTARHDAS